MNLHEYIEKNRDAEFFEPSPATDFHPTDAIGGSPAKIEVMRLRVELGLPIHHKDDYRGDDGEGYLGSRSTRSGVFSEEI